MIDFAKFFQLSYLFDLRPFTTAGTIQTMMIFFSILVVMGIGIKIYNTYKTQDKFWKKLLEKKASLLITMGLLGIGMTWLRYERVQILSARFWLIVWAITVIIWMYPIIKYWLTVVPEARKRSEEKKMFVKYLPKKK